MSEQKKPDIFVDYEYGDIEEVVVGVPYAIYPDLKVAKWLEESLKVLPEEEARKVRERSGKDTYEIGKYEPMEKENRDLIDILKGCGVKVWRPDVLNRERVAQNFGEYWIRFAGASQQYTRDPITVIGSHVIENSMGSLYRRADILGFRELFLKRVMGSNARWVAMPGVDYSVMIEESGLYNKTGFPVLEGGDVIVLGQTILLGTSRNRTDGSNELGFRWLKAYLEPYGFKVKNVPLREDILHLDIALSVPREGVVIVCPEAFPGNKIPPYFTGWKTIKVGKDEARHLAVNGLPINQDTYLVGTNEHFKFKDLEEPLHRAGVKEVIPIPFGNHTEDGGSIRCSTHPLVRRMRKD